MNYIEIINNTSGDLQDYIDDLYKFINYSLEYEKLDNVLFNIIFVDNSYIRDINKKYRNIDKSTDVISFALEDYSDCTTSVRVLGDIYISIDKAREQSLEYNHSLKREISFLSIHGLLHLLGYDHMNEEEEKIMFSKQEEILNSYGITR